MPIDFYVCSFLGVLSRVVCNKLESVGKHLAELYEYSYEIIELEEGVMGSSDLLAVFQKYR